MAESVESEKSLPPDDGSSPLRRNRNFRRVWVGQVLSDLGSEFGLLAYPLLALALTHSALIAGAIGTVASGAAFVVRLPAGALTDRLDRRRTMILCDATRTALLGLLAAAVAVHAVSWPVVMIVAVLDRLGSTLFDPAGMAALPVIVPNDQLEAAWAATEARVYAAGIAGPALGGLLYSVGRAVPFIGDAVSYGVSAATSARLTGDYSSADRPRTGLWRESFEASRFVWRDDLMRAVVVQAPLINFAFTGVVYTVTLGLRTHGVAASVIGIAQAGISVGGILGALLASRLATRLSIHRLLVVLTGGGTAFIALAAFIMPSPLLVIPIAAPILLAPALNASVIAVTLRRTPDDMRGRAMSAITQATMGLSAFAPLVAGILVTHISSQWAMGGFAIVMGVCALLALRLKGLRLASDALLPADPAEGSV